MKSGVYQIINVVNGKRYIGSSSNVETRIVKHRSKLKKGTHPNKNILEDYVKYGANAFTYYVLEYCECEFLIEREQYYLDSYGLSNLYNIAPFAENSRKGVHTRVSPESEFKEGNEPWNKGLKGAQPYMNLDGLEKGRGLFKGTKGVLKANKTSFKRGLVPWNKGKSGVMPKPWNKGLAKIEQRNCEYCQKVFTTKASPSRIGRGRFCSRRCSKLK